ncbi:MAG: putative capsular polysaccharide synthesis family protein [Anaerolineales bacterium]
MPNLKALLIDNLLSKNYALATLSSEFWFRRQLRGKNPLFIYQMGKVGSTTLLDTLHPLLPQTQLYHLHVLSDAGIRQEDQNYYGGQPTLFSKSRLPAAKHLFESKFIRKQMARGLTGIKIITLCRDPVGREVSAFFQRNLPDERFRQRLGDPAQVPGVVEDFWRGNEFAFALNWFDRELKAVFGFDVYAHPFPHEQGYGIYEQNGVGILVIKMEALNVCFQPALKEFLGVGVPALKQANVTKAKGYQELQTAFLNALTFSPEFLDEIYNSKYATHFYTEAERQAFRARWTENESKRVRGTN